MSKKTVFTIIAVIILLTGVTWFTVGRESGQTNSSTTSPDSQARTTKDNQIASPESLTQEVSDCETSSSPEITFADGNFSPSCVRIKSGTAINWRNTSSKPVEVGTDPHPSHTGNREVSGGDFVLELMPGRTATSTLSSTGEHSFHDHLSPTATGVIIVE